MTHADPTEAAAAFCAGEYPQLVRALSLYVGDLHVAEELAQEALLRVCQHWPRVSRLDSPGGWTWRVATNLANSSLRRRQAERRATRRLSDSTLAAPRNHDGADAVMVRAAITALPTRQRTAVVLRFVLDLSIDQTAARMEISSDAVRALTKRATATLRYQLTRDVRLPGGGS